MMKLYNTLSGKINVLKPADGKTFKIYNCGPTVYDYAHIGNLRTFTLQDLLRRFLEFKGFKVNLVMNVTDVDDKTIKSAQNENISLKKFTKKYTKSFFADTKALGIKKPTKTVFATKEISEMVKLIQRLLRKGIAYKSDDASIYFSIKKFSGYGKLSKLKIKKLKEGARVSHDNYEKNQARDFVLWKAWQKNDGTVFWDTPLGKGRPGWHVECSAMSLKHLGIPIDIHGGGVDLVFPHHENETTQSEAFAGKQIVRHWFHCAHLIVEGRKMSKSLGNFYTLRDLTGFDPRAIRLLFLSAHYRHKLNFSKESLEKMQKTIEGFDNFIKRLNGAKGKGKSPLVEKLLKKANRDFEESLDSDLDTPKMLAGLHFFFHQANSLLDQEVIGKKEVGKIIYFLKKINTVLGIFVFSFKTGQLSKEEKQLIEKREQLRKEKNFLEADKIREILLQKGIRLNDTADGVKWEKNAPKTPFSKKDI